MPTQRNFLINTTTISTTASGTTIASGNTQSATFVVAQTLVRSGIAAAEFASGSQTWAVHYVVSAMATPYEMRLKVQRRNSGGTMQAESAYATVRSATGTYDDNLIADLGVWAANDQLALVWEHRRPSGTGNKNGTIDANGSSYIDAPTPPLDLPKTVSDDVNNFADAEGLGHGNLHTDSVNNLADTVSLLLGHALSLSDDVNNLADGEVKLVGVIITAEDSLQALTDALTQLLTYELAFADSEAANWADSHNLLLSQFLALADLYTIADEAALEGHSLLTLSDSAATLTDDLAFQPGQAAEFTDSLNTFSDSLAIGLGLSLSDSTDASGLPRPNILFLEAGGASGGLHLYPLVSTSTPVIDTAIKPAGAHSSIKCDLNQYVGVTGLAAGSLTGGRISFYFYTEALPTGDSEVVLIFEDSSASPDPVGLLRLTTAGLLQWQPPDLSTPTDGTHTISINTWYALSVCYNFHNTVDNFDATIFVNGAQDLVATAQFTNGIPPGQFRLGSHVDGGPQYFSHIYLDDGADLDYPGDIRTTAKFPTTVNDDQFDTTGGTGAVNERPLNESNYRQQAASSVARQNYNLEIASAGDIDISGAPIIGIMGWLRARKSSALGGGVPSVTVDGVDYPTSSTAFSTSPATILKPVNQTTYPSSAAGIGLVSAGTGVDYYLYECGVVIATVAALPVGLADSLAYDLVAVQPPDMTLGLSDTLTSLTDSLALGYGLLPTDTLDPLLDALTVQSDGSLEAADTIVLSDTETHTLEFQLSFAETVSLDDSVELGYGIEFSDALSLTDAIALQLDHFEAFSDTLVLTDSEAHLLSYDETLSDDLNVLADSIALQLGHEIALTDAVVLSDTHTLELGQQLTFTDSIVLADSYAHDLINTVEGTTEEFADDINLLTDSLALGIGLVFSDNVDNLTDAETNTLGYSLDFADTLNLSDTISLELQYLLTLDDSFSLTDDQSSTLDYSVSLSDSVNNLADAVAVELGHLLALSDSIDNLADSHTETIAPLLDFSDALTLTDSILLGYGLSVSEDVNFLIDAIETSAPQGPLREVGLTDAIDLSDGIALELGYLLEVADNAATLDDSQALTEGLLTAFSDSISLTDAAASTLDYLTPLADSFTLSDAAQVHLGYGLDLSDSVALDDSISLRVGYELAASDSLNLSDTIDLAEGYLIAFSDSFTLTDAETARLDYLTSLADSLILTDAIQLRLDHELNLSDTVTLTDSISAGSSLNLDLADNVSLLADSLAFSYGFALILADNGPVFAESVEFSSAWQLRFSDTLTLTDSLAKSGTGSLSLEDTLAITDSAVIELRGPDLEEAVADSLVFTDAIALSLANELQLQVTASDTLVLSDHYFDLRLPYTPNLKRNTVVPSQARTTTISSERLVIVPARNRTTTIE